jgi:serine/threonine protein kinase
VLQGETLLEGRYKIVKILGQGGMGAVYLAEDQRLPTKWAIKEMKRDGLSAQELQDAAQLFHTEAKLLSQLRHRNLPRIVDFFQREEQLYLVMDFIEGETLEARIARDGPIPLPFALDLCLQISDVLDYLHTRDDPVVFRDFKPGNVMLTPQDEVKLVDFGIARIFSQDKSKDTQALGTPGYAAPEQYGKGQSGPQTDLYAFGATIHHALSGRDPTPEPFQFPSLAQFRQDLPPELVALIEACLSLKPGDRPESAFAIKRQIEQMLGQTGSSSLAGRPTTTRLGPSPTVPMATAPGTLPLPSSAAPEVSSTTSSVGATAPSATGPMITPGHSVAFMPNVLSFKDLAVGSKATARLRIKTLQPINLVCSSPNLSVAPTKLDIGTSTVMVTLDSKGLEGGSIYRAHVEVQEVEEADLPVEAHLARPRASTAVQMTAVLLAICTLVPFLNYLCTVVMSVMILSTPKPQRPSLRIPWRLSLFFSICWSGLFAAVGLGLMHAYGPADLNWNFLPR